MIDRQFVPSSLGEADYLPSGLYAVSVPTEGLQIQGGEILPLPPGETALRYPALAADGRIACQPQASVRGAWVWDGAQWTTDPRIPAAPNSQIFDNLGVLFINQLGPGYVGSNGYRYVNPSNVIITGDATYAGRNGVAEWTDLSLAQDGSLLVGYAVWTLACIVWDGTHHRLLESGDAKRLRAHRSGDVLTIAITTHDGAALIRMLVSDVPTLLVFEPTPPVPPDPPIPPVPPDPPVPPIPPIPPIPPTPPIVAAGEPLMDLQGTIYCTKVIPHPVYPGSFTYQLPFADNRVFSCNPDGSAGTAPAGTQGQHETGQPTGNVVTFQPTGNVFWPFAVLMVDKLWP